MKDIEIKKLTESEIKSRNIPNWHIWEKEISTFDWYYDTAEECYIINGEAVIKTPEGEITIRKSDFVTFGKGLKCIWKITQPIKKYYRFI